MHTNVVYCMYCYVASELKRICNPDFILQQNIQYYNNMNFAIMLQIGPHNYMYVAKYVAIAIFHIVQTKRGSRSMECKKLRRKTYRQKKKSIFRSKYYGKLSEDSLKKRYRSIPIGDRLPIGIIGSDHEGLDKERFSIGVIECDHDELEAECICKSVDQQFEKPKELVDMDHNLPPIFDPVLVPVEESLPSPGPSKQHDVMRILQCKDEVLKARTEHDNALILAKHYRNMAENSKKDFLCLQQRMKSEISCIEQQSVSRVKNIKNFWRNQIIEGDSRAGRILRASLIRK